jgi:hypothetical protein
MVLMLTDAARKAVIESLEITEPRLRPDGDLYGVRDWAAKVAGAVVRLAALMHIAGHLRDGYRQPFTEDTMRAGTAPLSSLTGICATAGARRPGH